MKNKITMETLLRFPLVKTFITTWKLITLDENFWKASVVSRLLTLKLRGVKFEDFKKMAEGFGRSKRSEVIFKYATKYFIKVVPEDLFSGIIVTGIFDVFIDLPLKTFVNVLFLMTFVFSILDTLAFLKVEFTAIKHREAILSVVDRLYNVDGYPTLKMIQRVMEDEGR